MYSDRRGNGQKPPRTKPSRQKTPGQKPGQKPPRTNEKNLYMGLLSGFVVLGLLKIGGSRFVPCFGVVPGFMTKCDIGERGSKLSKNSVTYFMDGPMQPRQD